MDNFRGDGVCRSKRIKQLIDLGFNCWRERVIVHLGKRPGNLSIVGTRVKVNDFEALFDELDGGDEGLSLDTIDVEFIRMPTIARQRHETIR